MDDFVLVLCNLCFTELVRNLIKVYLENKMPIYKDVFFKSKLQLSHLQ